MTEQSRSQPFDSKPFAANPFASNPFDSELALANSAYLAFQNDRLVCVSDPGRPVLPRQNRVHQAFRALVLSPDYSCVGAKAAVNGGQYRLGVYGDMTSSGALAGLARDLYAFVQEQDTLGGDFTTFVAGFGGPQIAGEEEFEARLWETLQALYDVDRLFHPPDPKVADDPEAANFGFSFAGRGFFCDRPASGLFAAGAAVPLAGISVQRALSI